MLKSLIPFVFIQEGKVGATTEVKQQIHKPKQLSQPNQERKLLHNLQQRKQKQEELIALNAKLKSLSKPTLFQSKERLESVEELDCKVKEKEDKVVAPHRKVVSLAERQGKPGQDLGSNTADSFARLQQAMNFSDSESDESNDDDKSETSEESEEDEEENDSFIVKDVQLHAKNHDTNDRNNNNNETLAAQTNDVDPLENSNHNNRASPTPGSESSRSSNILEKRSQSNSDRGPTPVSNHLCSSGGSSTLKFDTQNSADVSHGNFVTHNGSEETKEFPSSGKIAHMYMDRLSHFLMCLSN